MAVLYPRCAGLDVNQKTVVGARGSHRRLAPPTFNGCSARPTRDLLALADWLAAQGSHVVMEAIGVYWKPVWHTLEGQFELVLANAMHVRNIPGPKTDVDHATWLSDLLAHGLIRGSFLPPPSLGDLRDLTRTQVPREAARHTQRIQKVLQDAHLKLTTVVSDILGASGRAILTALTAGERDPERLAGLTRGRLRASRAELVAALHGRLTEHHSFSAQAAPHPDRHLGTRRGRCGGAHWREAGPLSACRRAPEYYPGRQ